MVDQRKQGGVVEMGAKGQREIFDFFRVKYHYREYYSGEGVSEAKIPAILLLDSFHGPYIKRKSVNAIIRMLKWPFRGHPAHEIAEIFIDEITREKGVLHSEERQVVKVRGEN